MKNFLIIVLVVLITPGTIHAAKKKIFQMITQVIQEWKFMETEPTASTAIPFPPS